jgi:hypothetical protein
LRIITWHSLLSWLCALDLAAAIPLCGTGAVDVAFEFVAAACFCLGGSI